MNKQTKIIIVSVIFLLVFIADIWAVLSNNTILEHVFKPLLMTSLALVYLTSVTKPNFWYLSALFFSFWGDVLLLFKEEFFVFGLASFLIAHVFYIKITIGFLKKTTISKILMASLPFLVFMVLLLNLVIDNLDVMKVPVIVYGIIISLFGTVAFLNYMTQKNTVNLWLFLGAIIFIASDSLIAIDRFYETKEIYSVLIMVTYIVAQYLICKAIIIYSKIKFKESFKN